MPSNLAAPTLLGLLTFIIIYLRSLASWRARSRWLPLPLGPKGLPFIGNFFHMPKSRVWLGFRNLCAEYGAYHTHPTAALDLITMWIIGNVVCLRVLNQSVVILGDPDVILAFMDRRSANTSSRVQTPSFSLCVLLLIPSHLVYEVLSHKRTVRTGHDWNWAFLPYGQSWRYHRRMFWQHFNPGAIDKYKPAQQAFARQFLYKLLENKGVLKDHIQL